MTRLSVHVAPRSSRTAFERVDGDGVLHLRVTAAPAGGAANAAAIALLAGLFGVPKSSIVLESGHRSRSKRFRLPLAASEVEGRLRELAGSV